VYITVGMTNRYARGGRYIIVLITMAWLVTVGLLMTCVY